MTEAYVSGGWQDLALYLSALAAEERESVSRQTGLQISVHSDEVLKLLTDSEVTESSASEFVALLGVRVALEDDRRLATKLGEVGVQLAESVEERQLAHACLAQSAFRFRKDPEGLSTFEEHCEAAIALGHAGTFCYERLAVLYEYRDEPEKAIEVCKRAEAALGASGDERSAERFREKAGAIRNRRKRFGQTPTVGPNEGGK